MSADGGGAASAGGACGGTVGMELITGRTSVRPSSTGPPCGSRRIGARRTRRTGRTGSLRWLRRRSRTPGGRPGGQYGAGVGAGVGAAVGAGVGAGVGRGRGRRRGLGRRRRRGLGRRRRRGLGRRRRRGLGRGQAWARASAQAWARASAPGVGSGVGAGVGSGVGAGVGSGGEGVGSNSGGAGVGKGAGPGVGPGAGGGVGPGAGVDGGTPGPGKSGSGGDGVGGAGVCSGKPGASAAAVAPAPNMASTTGRAAAATAPPPRASRTRRRVSPDGAGTAASSRPASASSWMARRTTSRAAPPAAAGTNAASSSIVRTPSHCSKMDMAGPLRAWPPPEGPSNTSISSAVRSTTRSIRLLGPTVHSPSVLTSPAGRVGVVTVTPGRAPIGTTRRPLPSPSDAAARPPPMIALAGLEPEATILVQIASYRDPELPRTVASALANAQRPDRLRFAVCWQYDEHTLNDLDPWCDDARFRIDEVHFRSSGGCCWARSRTNALFEGEAYTLQVDAHTRFATDWDRRFVEMLAAVGSDHPLLTTYPAAYEVDPAGHDTLIPAADALRLQVAEVRADLTVRQVAWPADPSTPGPSPLLAAGLIFTLGRFCEDVPYDPDMYFAGEEISMAARAYTSGYDLAYPNDALVWHRYRHAARLHWDDHRDTAARHAHAISRLRELLVGDASALGRFGLGTARSRADFERHCGIDFAALAVHPALSARDPDVCTS